MRQSEPADVAGAPDGRINRQSARAKGAISEESWAGSGVAARAAAINTEMK